MKDMTLKDMAEQWWTGEKGNLKAPRRGTPRWRKMHARFILETFGIDLSASPKARREA
jgi:hypothetical protein